VLVAYESKCANGSIWESISGLDMLIFWYYLIMSRVPCSKRGVNRTEQRGAADRPCAQAGRKAGRHGLPFSAIGQHKPAVAILIFLYESDRKDMFDCI
jgi:hypothetical protein